jgi:gp16 family phage-associated protein
MSTSPVISADQLKAKFAQEGKTFSSWAEDRGYRREDVYRVINGLTRCRRGKVHQIAVELGLKAA